MDTVPFGTFRREIFQKAGFFDERLTRNQDNEFNARLIRAGYKIAFDPKIKIQYRNQASLSGLLFQAYYTGMVTPKPGDAKALGTHIDELRELSQSSDAEGLLRKIQEIIPSYGGCGV